MDYLDKDDPYQMIVPYDDSPVDMDILSTYYHTIYDMEQTSSVSESIRTRAVVCCDMLATMKPVVDWLLIDE